jgi:hypothetical protein
VRTIRFERLRVDDHQVGGGYDQPDLHGTLTIDDTIPRSWSVLVDTVDPLPPSFSEHVHRVFEGSDPCQLEIVELDEDDQEAAVYRGKALPIERAGTVPSTILRFQGTGPLEGA